ncbi:MAG: hypothetical protein AAF708_15190 [Deinococcota bacterium]
MLTVPPDNLTELMPPPERWLKITGEQIPDLTADHIFLLLFDDGCLMTNV